MCRGQSTTYGVSVLFSICVPRPELRLALVANASISIWSLTNSHVLEPWSPEGSIERFCKLKCYWRHGVLYGVLFALPFQLLFPFFLLLLPTLRLHSNEVTSSALCTLLPCCAALIKTMSPRGLGVKLLVSVFVSVAETVTYKERWLSSTGT